MKALKRVFIFIALIGIVSCSSEGNEPDENQVSDYFITFEVNGEAVTCKDVLSFDNYGLLANGIYGAGVVGANGQSNGTNSGEAILLYMYDTVEITSGKTYTEAFIPGKYLSGATITYSISEVGYTSAAPNISNVSNARITLTEITSEYAAGVFSGILVTNNDYNTIAKTIENGKFKLKINK
ncbi:hypothetical protein [Mariniflexile sp.]|uniref:hypothetical protein n=1 Tax=Mariniflexile sp. TaxID=1979402 RepID=UPI003569BF83